MTFETIAQHVSFGGRQLVLRHKSNSTKTDMEVSLFLPPAAKEGPVPTVFYLSGLTCTWENATVKAGFQKAASRLGMAIVAPDTSPRGESVPNVPEYDFGQGAGFYVNATEEPWSANFRMYDYVVNELPALLSADYPLALSRAGITGHSMGGHGALTIALGNPEKFRSVSAFAPIVSPTRCPWGQKALGGYLGEDRSAWDNHDATVLVARNGWHGDILIDQGDADQFLSEQLKPHLMEEACNKAGIPLTLRMQPGYDHSYYFIASFMDDHIEWHAERLKS